MYHHTKLLPIKTQTHFVQNTLNGGYKPASVLVPIITPYKNPHVIMIKRQPNLPNHGGQVAFPGGKIETYDQSPMQAAIREAHEEIGLNPISAKICGALPPRNTTSQFTVIPFVAHIKNTPKLKKQHREVSDIFTVPLEFLLNPDNHFYDRTLPQNPYFLQWKTKKIWGVTASVIRDLYEISCAQNAKESS